MKVEGWLDKGEAPSSALVKEAELPSSTSGETPLPPLTRPTPPHAKSVTGIDIGYTLEMGQQPVGHDGQQMDAPTVSKRNAVQPNFTFGEVTGNLVFRVIQTWLWDISDPDTQISMARLETDKLMPFTMSAYPLSFIALQFDQTYTANRLLGAIYITNVYPQGTGDFGLKREPGNAAVQDRPITYTGLAIENESIFALGKAIAADLGLHYKENYYNPGDPYSDGNDMSRLSSARINPTGNPYGARNMSGIIDETSAAGQGAKPGQFFVASHNSPSFYFVF